MECIILAGGFGTRLQAVIGEYPKCMAPVNGKPFLRYLFDYLIKQNCSRAILSLGYKHEVILDWLQTQTLPFIVDYVIESEPLGTGGGIQLAMKQAHDDTVAILNGDSLFLVNMQELMEFHKNKNAEATLSLKEMQQFDRYGCVNIDETNCIVSFDEKKYHESGLINGGVYIINKAAFQSKKFSEQFSFEKQYLEHYVDKRKFFGYTSDDYFIDIGVPADYARAQEDFKTLFQ